MTNKVYLLDDKNFQACSNTELFVPADPTHWASRQGMAEVKSTNIIPRHCANTSQKLSGFEELYYPWEQTNLTSLPNSNLKIHLFVICSTCFNYGTETKCKNRRELCVCLCVCMCVCLCVWCVCVCVCVCLCVCVFVCV